MQVAEIATRLVLCLAVFACFGRADFLNLTLGAVCFYCQIDDTWSRSRCAFGASFGYPIFVFIFDYRGALAINTLVPFC